MVHAVHSIILVVLGAALISCSWLNPPNHFYSASVDDIEIGGPNRRAHIVLTEMKVSSRATLQNDRKTEATHLVEELKESAQADYSPQLRRDVSTIAVLSGQLGIKFDPAMKLQFEQYALASEVEQVKLQAELERVKFQLGQLRQGQGSGPAPPTNETGKPPSPIEGEKKDVMEQLKTLLDSTTARMDKLASNRTDAGAVSNSLKSSPEDRYDSLQAHRARIRSDLSAVRLDDLHSYSENTLYRLHFEAVVYPSKANKNRWGFVRAKVAPVQLIDEAMIGVFYQSWLDHITVRLNRYSNRRVNRNELGQLTIPGIYWDLSEKTKLFGIQPKVIPLKDDADCPKEIPPVDLVLPEACVIIYVASLPAATGKKELKTSLSKQSLSEQYGELKSRPAFKDYILTPKSAGQVSVKDYNTIAKEYEGKEMTADTCKKIVKRAVTNAGERDVFDDTVNLADRSAVVASGLRALQFKSALPARIKEAVGRAYREADVEREPLRDDLMQAVSGVSEECKQKLQVPSYPASFKTLLDASIAPSAPQESSVYSTYPTERFQRLSTVGSAANSLQMALALAATMPQYGVGMNAGLGYSRSMAGRVDALERSPLVMGVSGRLSNANASIGAPWFGWVLGPKVRIDAEGSQLKFEQILSRHSVGVELSVPAWWPKIKLTTEAVWVGDWGTVSDPTLSPVGGKEEVIEVPLPVTAEGYDALTAFIARGSSFEGSRYASIDIVQPDKVSACNGAPTSFFISGAYLWREPQVYLNGVPAREVKVRPDMTGIHATFELSGVPVWLGDSKGKALLTVDTATGSAEYGITITDQAQFGGCARKPADDAALDVQNVRTRFVRGDGLSLKVTRGRIPPPPIDVKVALRLYDAEVNYEWEPRGAAKFDADTQLLTSAAMAVPDDRLEFMNGRELEAAVLVTPRTGVQPEIVQAKNRLIYYSSSPASRITITTQMVEEIGEASPILVELPRAWWKAYPNFRGVAGIIEADQVNLEAEGELPHPDSVKYIFTLRPQKADAAKYESLHKAKNLTVKIVSRGDPDTDLPEIIGTITITKGK